MPDLIIDQSRRCVYVDGQEIQLSPQEYRVLYHLGQNAGTVVSKQDLLVAMWSTAEPDHAQLVGFTPAAVDLVIFRVRKKLNDDAQQPIFLETRRGFGYILHHARVVRSEVDRLGSEQTDDRQGAIVSTARQPEFGAPAFDLTSAMQPWSTLTRREWTIFLQLGDEQTIRMTDKALAQQLQMAEGTLKKHLQHIYRKLAVENRSGATLLAMRVKAHFSAKDRIY